MKTCKGVLSIFVAALTIAGVWFVAVGGSAVGFAADDPLQVTVFPTIYECYSVIEGDVPNRRVRLTTQNFGGDIVVVQQLVAMCEEATKTTANGEVFGQIEEPTVFACYRIDRGADPDDSYFLKTVNFGTHSVDVRKGVVMCESARKTRLDQPGVRPIGQPGKQALAGFQLRSNIDPQASVRLETTNFGSDGVVIRRPAVMLEEARKDAPQLPPVGQPTGRVWECFNIQDGDDPQARVLLETTNFGRDEVIVGRGILMCEEASKSPNFGTTPVAR